eukprot:4600111-Pleurochrysis_carterae.AAC.2
MVMRQLTGTCGGEEYKHVFVLVSDKLVSDKLVALFFKPTSVSSYNQGSLLLRDEDGAVLAIIAPATFCLKYTLPLHLTDSC